MFEAAEVHYQAAIRQIKRICISLLDTECNFAYFYKAGAPLSGRAIKRALSKAVKRRLDK